MFCKCSTCISTHIVWKTVKRFFTTNAGRKKTVLNVTDKKKKQRSKILLFGSFIIDTDILIAMTAEYRCTVTY